MSMFFMSVVPLLFCSAFLLFSSSFICTVAVAASFDRNENHDTGNDNRPTNWYLARLRAGLVDRDRAGLAGSYGC